jgi:NhaP-type Na+/H+ or K+/H+ antiporter
LLFLYFLHFAASEWARPKTIGTGAVSRRAHQGKICDYKKNRFPHAPLRQPYRGGRIPASNFKLRLFPDQFTIRENRFEPSLKGRSPRAVKFMTFAAMAALFAAAFWIQRKLKAVDAAYRAPALMLMAGAGASFLYRATGAPFAPAEWTAAGADVLLAALAFAAAAQFRVSRLASACPASFWLTIGGAPLFLVTCGIGAFALAPHLTLTAALLVAGALALNGAAFDRRAVADAPAPAIIKAAVRLESAAVLALGLPVAVLLEAAATAAPLSLPAVTPLFEAGKSIFAAFALGGGLGLAAALMGNQPQHAQHRTALAVAMAALAAIGAALLDAHPAIAAGSAGLVWGEQTRAYMTARVRLRRIVERAATPAAYFAFGLVLAPRIFQADFLSLLFAVAAVTIMRVGPRLAALRQTRMTRQGRMFLAWFGGAPGAASALFLISLLDAASIVAQDAVLTIGALAATLGVFAARISSRPLIKLLLKETALAKKRAMYAG